MKYPVHKSRSVRLFRYLAVRRSDIGPMVSPLMECTGGTVDCMVQGRGDMD